MRARARARWRERERRRDGDFCNQNPNQNGARASVSKHARHLLCSILSDSFHPPRSFWYQKSRAADGLRPSLASVCELAPSDRGVAYTPKRHPYSIRRDRGVALQYQTGIGPGHPQRLFVRPLCAVSKLVRHLCHSSASDRGVSCTVTEVSHLLTDTGVAHTPVRHPDTVRGVSLAYTK